MPKKNDVIIIGGGIIGLASALSIMKSRPSTRLTLIEKETGVAQHQRLVVSDHQEASGARVERRRRAGVGEVQAWGLVRRGWKGEWEGEREG